jgi:hypothetical protein
MHYHACEAYCPEVLPSGQVARSSRDLNLCCEFGKLRNRTRRGVQLGLGEVIRPSRQDSEELNHIFGVVDRPEVQWDLILAWSYCAGRGEVSAKLLVMKPSQHRRLKQRLDD